MKTRFRTYPKGSIIRRLAVSYLALLLIPIALGISIYFRMLPVLQRQVADIAMAMLQNQRDNIDKSMYEVYTLIHRLFNTAELSNFLATNYSPTSAAINDTIKLINALPPIIDENQLIKDYYIYSSLNELALAPRHAFLNIERYYKSHFRYGNLDFAKWRREMMLEHYNMRLLPAQDAMYEAKSERMLLFMQHFPEYRGGQPIGQIFVYIDEARILEMMQPARSVEASFSCIADFDGQILAYEHWGQEEWNPPTLALSGKSGTFEADFGGALTLVSYILSSDSRYYHVMGVPEAVISGRANNVLRTTLYFTAIMVVFGLLGVAVIIRLNGKPLNTIIGKLSNDDMKLSLRSDYKQVDEAVSNLVALKDQLDDTIIRQRATLKEMLFSEIIYGGLPGTKETESLLDQLGMDIAGASYRGVLMCVILPDESPETAINEGALNRALKIFDEHPSRIPMYRIMSPGVFYMVFVQRDRENDDFSVFFTDIYHDLEYLFGFSPIFYAGDRYETLGEVHRSFATARHLYHMQIMAQRRFIVTDQDINADYSVDDRWCDIEKKINNLLGVSDYHAIEALLEELYSESFIKDEISIHAKRLLLCHMIELLAKLGDNTYIDVLMKEGWHQPSASVFTAMKAHCAKLCKQAQSDSIYQDMCIAEEAIAYMRGNYMDSTLTLYGLSRNLGVKEGYLYSVIKKVSGLTFSALLEQIRIERANELLKESRLTINEITEATGYLSAHTFRRAYKRVMGCPPSALRNTNEH